MSAEISSATASNSLSFFDANDYRSRTPGVSSSLYLNAASAALPSGGVIAAVKAHLDLEGQIGPQAATARAKNGLAVTRERAAAVLGCRSDQIAFGESSSRLWLLMFHALKFPKRRRILVSRGEWGGNLLAIEAAARSFDLIVETIPTDEAGTIDLDCLRARLDDDVKLIAVTAVSSTNGIRQPIDAIGALERPTDCLYVIDAAQIVGRFAFHMEQVHADVVTVPARKWVRGPRGQAFAAFSDAALSRLPMPPLLDLASVDWSDARKFSPRSDARRFETYEYSIAGRLGLGVALGELLNAGPTVISEAIDGHVRMLRSALAKCEHIRVNEPTPSTPAFLTLDCGNLKPADVAHALSLEGVVVASVGRAYAPNEMDARHLSAVVRISPHAYSHADEITRFAKALERVVTVLRKSLPSTV